MIEIQYTVTGLEELMRKFGPGLIEQPMRTFFELATTEIKGEVQLETPVDTGRLRQSIHSITDPQPLPLWGSVSTNVMYAPFVEEDTRPHWTSAKNLALWAKSHGLNVYALQWAIARRGTRGKHMFQQGLLTWTFTRMESLLSQTARAIEAKWSERR